jgi:hypothetical protein
MMLRARGNLAVALLVGTVALLLAGCQQGGGTSSVGVGTAAGAAAGVGASRARLEAIAGASMTVDLAPWREGCFV